MGACLCRHLFSFEEVSCRLQDRSTSSVQNREMEDGARLLKCKKIFYISIDISFDSAYNKCEEMEGGHRNEV